MSDIMAIIPARSGSKGIINKNIKLLNGHPLLAYSVRAACLTKGIGRVVVSTDSEEYASIARKYGAETPFLRPKEISKDDSTDLDLMFHAFSWFEKHEGFIPRLVVHLRPTGPLRQPQVIEGAIQAIEFDKTSTALRSIAETPESVYKWCELDGDYLTCVGTKSRDIDATSFGRQFYTKTYEPNGHVDILKSDFMLKNKKIYGDRVIGFHSPRGFMDIDNQENFDVVTLQAEHNKELCDAFFKSL
ncbi:MAG: acylneuraminate cytidylyltransferase family protein [Nitrospina sp.]|nr:acylneuraminate cytidylyltransferase family protein [Nitrospina sp.]